MQSDFKITGYIDEQHRESVIQLWKTVFGYEDAHNKPSLVIDKKLDVADGLLFLATQGDTLVGTIMAGYDGHRGWLYSVAVSPQHRLLGIGTKLIKHAEQALVSLGCLKINLQIVAGNEAVTSFYQTLGYNVEARVSMGKRLTLTNS